MKTVAIAGVGLIGGSFALALRQSGFTGQITGVSSPRTIAEAMAHGIIDREMTLAEAAATADVVLLAQPIGRIVQMMEEMAPHLGPATLVTDAGSTKALICAAAARFLPAEQFLGGHPMAGKESRGAASADGGLFRGRTWVLTRALEHPFVDWVRKIGAHVLVLGPEEHDRTVALTSHLPQLVATALGCTVGAGLERDEQLRAGGPGLIDMTRLALSQFDMWNDILTTNAGSVDAALGAMIERLEAMRGHLRDGELRADFEAGAKLRRKLVNPVRLG
ncbi:MAG: prephenate dehydrogenase/arogenate dehydrogenase family protein [Bryobacterales bacterium]|nr:prephenate dehydrogenase/arogenate dehydrogenase family protein [Bryobacterales bacterium]